MAEIRKIIFVEEHGNERAMMAKAIFDQNNTEEDVEADAKGLVVLFPQPMNQKVEAVLISNGITNSGAVSSQLKEEDFGDEVLVLTMEEQQKQRILMQYENAKNVQLLTDLTGDELEIMDPYGGTLQSYGLCYESLSIIIKKLVKLVSKGER
ncbi:MAG: phosphotyrosine protein phosphatase [Lachnospiraceae bacterium]|jgi:protein-tyrosine phosphatase|nr:phosphotyrosine protein phosphatase [Lachnospiraceae bacterium]